MKKYTTILLSLSIFLVFTSAQASSLERLFAPKAKLWDTWLAHSPDSSKNIDHQAWTGFLQRYVIEQADGINRVDYGNVTDADKQQLKEYILNLSRLEISSYSRAEQLNYWINLYNALTIDVILEHYPVSSIRKIDLSPGLFKDGPWAKKLLRIQGEEVSLNDIEHRILRPIWKDPRLHYALNCASIGCPNLQKQAYTTGNIDTLFRKAAEDFINHPRGVNFSNEKLVLSSIYNWFRNDFGRNDEEILDHIRQYASDELRQQLNKVNPDIRYRYDWSLNDTASAK